jgi:hypothetical protein
MFSNLVPVVLNIDRFFQTQARKVEEEAQQKT